MEGKPSPHLKKVLKSYQLSAANTMSGPSSIMSRLDNAGGPAARNRNGSFDGTNSTSADSGREVFFQQSLKHLGKTPPIFSRGLGISLGSHQSQAPVLSRIAIVNGIKQEPGAPGSTGQESSKSPMEFQGEDDGGSMLIINKSPHQLPPPILSASDNPAKPEKRDTLLEGELIACFSVGGEKRLCFPQILKSVLQGFSLPQINQVCDELQIFCSRCSTEQLEVLKKTRVIPASIHSCGLITKTDAERLVNAILHAHPPKRAMSAESAVSRPQDPNKPQPNSLFRISHRCFGKATGVVHPLLYEKPDSLCIECIDCHGLFSPQRFVCHSHQTEYKTCHWGFDSSKWRNYITVAKKQDKEKLEKALEDFKARFDHRKRKESSESVEEWCVPGSGQSLGGAEDRVVIKRVRYSTDSSIGSSSPPSPSPYLTSPTSLSILPSKKRLSFLTQTDNEVQPQQLYGVNQYELDTVKKIIFGSMGREGADIVAGYLEKLALTVSSLTQICKNQEKVLRGLTEKSNSGSGGVELQVKVNSVEAEIHSMKKHILRRHVHHGEEIA